MKEKQRQQFLRELGYKKPTPNSVAEWLEVYIPYAVGERFPNIRLHCSVAEALALGAKNIHVKDGQLVAEWPQEYFTGGEK